MEKEFYYGEKDSIKCLLCKECYIKYDNYEDVVQNVDGCINSCFTLLCKHIDEENYGFCSECLYNQVFYPYIKRNREKIALLEKKIQLLESHIRYAPGGEGEFEALHSFLNLKNE